MLYSNLIVAVAALTGFASAQNSSAPAGIGDCCKVSSNVIPSSMRGDWCTAETNTCRAACGGAGKVDSNGNTCDSNTLNFTCRCSNKTNVNMDVFQQSVPGLMCRFWFEQCINATNQNLDQQVFCKDQRDTKCGNITIKDPDAVSTGASSSQTATGTGSGGQSSASPTGASASSSSRAAAAALAMATNYGTPVLAGGLMAVFGLAL